MRTRSRLPHWVPSIVVLLGTAALLGAGCAWYVQWSFMTRAATTDGRVVRMEFGRQRGSRPVVDFKTPDGREHTVSGTVYSHPPAYHKGQIVIVAYPPGHPDQARLTGFMDRYLLVIVLGGVGLVFTAVGTLVRLLNRRR